MKYVTIDYKLQGGQKITVPVLFPEIMNHDDIEWPGEVVSAGFVELELKRVDCHGESVKLKKQVASDDKALVELMAKHF